MSAFTESSANSTMRKRVPLREAFIEAFPEKTPVLTMVPKSSGKRPTSNNSSEIEWPFKTFRDPEPNAVYDGDDWDPATEAEDNEGSKDMVKGRLQLMRTGAFTGRIAEAVISQHGGIQAGTAKSIHKDHVKDALRGMRADKNWLIMSDQDSKAQTVVGGVKVPYRTRGFASWCRTGDHADLPVPSMAKIPAGSIKSVASAAAFTEDDLNAMMQSCWDARQENGNWKMFNVADMQTALNQFVCFGEQTVDKVPIRRFNGEVHKNTIELHVRIYKGSFGQIDSIPVKHMPTSFTQSVTTANGDATLTVASSAKMFPGMPVSGTGIPANTRILYIVNATTVELDANCTASATVTGTFGKVVYSELMDMEYLELLYVDEVGWADLENKGGGPRGYADCLLAFANLNPQAHAMVQKS